MWKQLNSKQIFKHPRITLIEDEVELPDRSVVSYLTFAHSHDSVSVICQDDSKILLSKQYSYPMNEILYEFAGGRIEQDELAIDAAKRELQEETGYIANEIQEIGWYYTNNRRTKAKMYVFLAINPRLGEKIDGDPEEEISTTWITEGDMKKMIHDGEIVNYSVLAAWAMYTTSI